MQNENNIFSFFIHWWWTSSRQLTDTAIKSSIQDYLRKVKINYNNYIMVALIMHTVEQFLPKVSHYLQCYYLGLHKYSSSITWHFYSALSTEIRIPENMYPHLITSLTYLRIQEHRLHCCYYQCYGKNLISGSSWMVPKPLRPKVCAW